MQGTGTHILNDRNDSRREAGLSTVSFKAEFERRVKLALLPDHADHDLAAIEVDYQGTDGYRYSSYTYEDPHAEVTAVGVCGCGQRLYGQQPLASEDFGAFMRKITDE